MGCGETIKHIKCHGTPYEMGVQYGEQARAEIEHSISGKVYRSLLATLGRRRRTLDAIHARLAKVLPDVYDELKGVADGARVERDLIVAMNHVIPAEDEDGFLDRCTPVGIVDDAGCAIISKNNDGLAGEREQYPFVVRETHPGKEFGLAMIQVTYAGWLNGLDTMNSAGVACAHASVGSVFKRPIGGVDIRLVAYQAMRHGVDVETFFIELQRAPLTGKGFNLLVGDVSGHMTVIEAPVPHLARREPEGRFIYTTNHYLSADLKDADARSAAGKQISQNRLAHLRSIERTSPPSDVEAVKAMLASHLPWGPCRHGGDQHSETLWSMVCHTADRALHLSHGSPCTSEYVTYSL